MANFRFISALLLTAVFALPASAADKQDSSIASEYQRVSKEFENAQRQYFEVYTKAKTDEERKKLKYPDEAKYARDLLAVAEKDPKDPSAVEALTGALMHGRYDKNVGPRALELLKTHHLESEKLGRACQIVTYGPSQQDNKAFLTAALEKNPHPDVKGAAALSLGMLHVADDPKEAEKHFNNVIEKYGTKEQKEAAKSQLFEMHNLAIGKVAPEIEGKDVDGKKFKLSDYRGKVVVLDFWGDW
jgi:AhpC/TSA family